MKRIVRKVGGRAALAAVLAVWLAGGDFGPRSEPLEEARRLFVKGLFQEAAALAETEESAEGLALAADSLGAHGLVNLPKEDREPVYAKAVEAAESGLERWPEDPGLLVAAASSLGRYGNAVGNRRAFEEKVALRSRDYLIRALEADPDCPAALAGLGGWHARLAAEGGFLAKMLMGADRSEGMRLIARAEPLVQDKPDLLYEMGRARSKAGDASGARRLLEAAVATKGPGVYADHYRARAQRLLDRL